MPKVREDVDIMNDANLEGSLVAIIGAFIVEHGQLMQYLQGHGVPPAVLMSAMTVVIQRLWTYARAGRQIAEMKLQARIEKMAEDAKAQARQVGVQPPAPPTYRQPM